MPNNKNTKNKKAVPASRAGSGKKSKDTLVEIALRRQYYKDGANYSKMLAGVSIGCMIASVMIATASINIKNKNEYLALNPDGTIINLTPLSQPNQAEPVIRNWLVEALTNTFQIDYLNFKTDLNKSIGQYFTTSGGNEFITSINNINLINTIKDKKLLVNFDVTTSPILLRSGNIGFGNAYGWDYQLNGMITMRNEKQSFSIPVVVQITVTRRNLLEDPKGLGIARVFIEKASK